MGCPSPVYRNSSARNTARTCGRLVAAGAAGALPERENGSWIWKMAWKKLQGKEWSYRWQAAFGGHKDCHVAVWFYNNCMISAVFLTGSPFSLHTHSKAQVPMTVQATAMP